MTETPTTYTPAALLTAWIDHLKFLNKKSPNLLKYLMLAWVETSREVAHIPSSYMLLRPTIGFELMLSNLGILNGIIGELTDHRLTLHAGEEGEISDITAEEHPVRISGRDFPALTLQEVANLIVFAINEVADVDPHAVGTLLAMRTTVKELVLPEGHTFERYSMVGILNSFLESLADGGEWQAFYIGHSVVGDPKAPLTVVSRGTKPVK